MRPFVFTLTATLLAALVFGHCLAQAPPAFPPEHMEERGGLIYKSGDKTPFTGLVRDFHQSGKPRLEAQYSAGMLASSKVWYSTGQIAEEVTVSAGAWTIKRFSEAGRLEEETLASFENGRRVSEQSRMWDETGKLRNEVGFKGGKLHGPQKEYDATGALVRDEVYDQGKLVRKNK